MHRLTPLAVIVLSKLVSIQKDYRQKLLNVRVMLSLRRALYASDASLYQIEPFAVACPHDADDVVTLVKYAAEHRLPLIARGGGSTASFRRGRRSASTSSPATSPSSAW